MNSKKKTITRRDLLEKGVAAATVGSPGRHGKDRPGTGCHHTTALPRLDLPRRRTGKNDVARSNVEAHQRQTGRRPY